VLDCPDPGALAAFYAEVLGMTVNDDSGDWVVIGTQHGVRDLAFQRASPWKRPRWPDPEYPQQLHVASDLIPPRTAALPRAAAGG
jgi:Glyoxalase-like domain